MFRKKFFFTGNDVKMQENDAKKHMKDRNASVLWAHTQD